MGLLERIFGPMQGLESSQGFEVFDDTPITPYDGPVPPPPPPGVNTSRPLADARGVEEGGMRRFELHRDEDVSGVSGTGVVAEGVAFTDGTVALRWMSEWPTSVVFHDQGLLSLVAIHGHNGRTRIVWLDQPSQGASP